MKQYTIKVIAPTVYQLRSLRSFNLLVKEVGNGSFVSEMEFDSLEDAEKYLESIAMSYYDEYKGQVDKYLADIKEFGMLTIDGVTAKILEKELMYDIQDRETGTFISSHDTWGEAKQEVADFESTDKINGDYVPNFYEIVEREL